MTIAVTVWLVAAYALVLLAIAWAIDRFGSRSAERSSAWRTGNFVYHEKDDAWKCHEDQWLYPAAFDPDKRVIRYQGQHAICGRCPSKDACSPTPGPREITRAVDPWPHSESGRFHRGLALAIAVIAGFLPAGMLFGASGWGEVIVLVTTISLVVAAGVPLARHLRSTPANFPEHLPQEGVAATAESHSAVAGDGPVPVAIRPSPYASDRRVVSSPATVDDLVERYAAARGIGVRRQDAKRAPTVPAPRSQENL